MQEQQNNIIIPASIIIAGFVIASGIYLTNKEVSPIVDTSVTKQGITLSAVSGSDHILGNPEAPITIVEFSDTECPFCQRFQTTMLTLMRTYGKDGNVSWVYRHFPLDSLHKKSRKEAEATECANELGGSKAFWYMLDTIYAETPGNDGLSVTQLPIFAKDAGVDVAKFNICLASGKYADLVESNFQDGVNAGAQGTPYNVLVLKDAMSSEKENTIQNYSLKNRLTDNIKISATKKEVVLNGALPVEVMSAIFDILLK